MTDPVGRQPAGNLNHALSLGFGFFLPQSEVTFSFLGRWEVEVVWRVMSLRRRSQLGRF